MLAILLFISAAISAPILCPSQPPSSFLPTGARLEGEQLRIRRFAQPFSSFQRSAVGQLVARIRSAAAGDSASACCVSATGSILCATTSAPRFNNAAAQRFVGHWELNGMAIHITSTINSLRASFGRSNERLLLQDENNAWLRKPGCVVSFHPSANDQLYVMAANTATCQSVVGGLYSRTSTNRSVPPPRFQ